MQTNKLITYSSQIQKSFLNLLSSVIRARPETWWQTDCWSLKCWSTRTTWLGCQPERNALKSVMKLWILKQCQKNHLHSFQFCML